MKVHLVRTKNYYLRELKKVYDLLFLHPGYLSFSLSEKALLFDTDNFEWDELFDAANQFRIDNNIPSEDFIIIITNLKNSANWFSAPNPAGTLEVFIDASDWENYIYADAAYPIAYEVITNILQRYLLRTWEDFNSPYIHKQAIGCINDFCQWKPDITFKLRTADICGDCLSALEERVPDKALISQCIEIMEQLRNGMLLSKLWRKSPEFEEHLPFPVAQTKRKLGMTQQAYTKLQLLIQHFDSLARSTSVIFSHLLLSNADLMTLFETCGLNEHPSLGHWVGAIKRISETGVVQSPHFDLPANIRSTLSQIHKLYESNGIVNLRNDTDHGYTELSDHIHIGKFNEKIKVASEIEYILYPYFKRFYYYQIASTDIKANNQFVFRVLDFSGSNSSFLEKEIEVRLNGNMNLPQSQKVYLVSQNLNSWVCLEPHWIFNICPSCQHPRLLISDGKQYLDPFVGHRVTC